MDPLLIKHRLLEIGRKACDIIRIRFNPLGQPTEYKEGKTLASQVVTAVDRELNQFITGELMNGYPSYGIRSEESEETAGNRYCFVVDPLDGTLNFQRGFPHCGVSLALVDQQEDQVLVGVVVEPYQNIEYSACRYGGAFVGHPSQGFPIEPTRVFLPKRRLKESFIVCGGTKVFLDGRLEQMRESFGFVVTCRSIAFEISTIASGGHDGGVLMSTDLPYDHQAAGLIAAEGGAIVTELDGSPWNAKSTTMITGSPAVHAKLLEIFNP